MARNANTTVVTVMKDGLSLNDEKHEIGDSVEITKADLDAIQALEAADKVKRVKVARTKTLEG